MIYGVYYNCPKCESPCNGDKLQLTSECIEAQNEEQAQAIFNICKPCGNMEIVGIDLIES